MHEKHQPQASLGNRDEKHPGEHLGPINMLVSDHKLQARQDQYA
jgi:hypothetical protein